jgi:hypothetical protein
VKLGVGCRLEQLGEEDLFYGCREGEMEVDMEWGSEESVKLLMFKRGN